MLVDSEGKISPATFPEPSTYPGSIEVYASNLRTAGERVSGLGDDIKSSWGGLTSCYQAPEAGELYSVLDPVATDGDTVQRAMSRAATALDNFAEDLGAIKTRWSSLRTEAWDLRARIAEKGDEWRDEEGFLGFFGYGDAPLVEENDALITKGTQIIEDYVEAERVCANAINLFVPDRTRFQKASSDGELDPNVFYHGFDQDLSELATEWGIEGAATDEHWWVDTGAAVWDFGVGAVEGLGAAVGAHSSEGWFSMSWDDALLENWEGSLQSVSSLVGMYDAESDSYGWAGWGTVGDAWTEAAHAVVPWEEWGDRPGYVIGTALLNIGVAVAGVALTATGVGAAVGVPLLAWRGASILNKMNGSRLADVDLSPGDSPSPISIQLNLPNFAGGNRTLFEFDLSGFGGVDPRRIQDMQDALARFAERNDTPDGTGDSGAPTGSRPRTGDDTSTTNDNRRTSQGSGYTVEDLKDGMTAEDLLEFNAIGEQLEPDFRRADAEKGNGGNTDGNWEGSGDGDDGRELEYAGLRPGPNHLENSATPDTPRNQRVDLSDSDPDFDIPEDFRPSGPDLMDRSPTVTNSVDNDTRPGDSPTNGNDGPNNSHADDQDNGSNTVTTGNGNGPTGSGSGLPGYGDSDPGNGSNNTDSPDQPTRERGGVGDEAWNDRSLGDRYRPPMVDPERIHTLRPGDNGYPGPRSVFKPKWGLEPNSMYDLGHRGRFYTDDSGEIRFVDTHAGVKGDLNPELRNPRPNATYAVDVNEHPGHKYFYETDGSRRTTHAHGDLQRLSDEVEGDRKRSEINEDYRASDQGVSGGRGRQAYKPMAEYPEGEWDGGHFIGTGFGGSGHHINLHTQLRLLNQKQTGGVPETNFYALEDHWRDLLANDHRVDVSFDVTYPSTGGQVPTAVRVRYSIDGVEQEPIRYRNVPAPRTPENDPMWDDFQNNSGSD
ncbi:DNA/RNA non-specific endonuclease [Nocardiopsis sp. Huas11]|nr:DNA/RNA non-specific endonuclease [Nocardiopsis sp. Huas11]